MTRILRVVVGTFFWSSPTVGKDQKAILYLKRHRDNYLSGSTDLFSVGLSMSIFAEDYARARPLQ